MTDTAFHFRLSPTSVSFFWLPPCNRVRLTLDLPFKHCNLLYQLQLWLLRVYSIPRWTRRREGGPGGQQKSMLVHPGGWRLNDLVDNFVIKRLSWISNLKRTLPCNCSSSINHLSPAGGFPPRDSHRSRTTLPAVTCRFFCNENIKLVYLLRHYAPHCTLLVWIYFCPV